MTRPDSTNAFNVLVVDNPLATPGPLWTAMTQTYSHSLSTDRRDSVLSATAFPCTTAPRGITLTLDDDRETEHWLLIDGTQRPLSEAAASTAVLVDQVHAVVTLISLAHYDPRGYRDSARWERDRALFRTLCEATWAAEAKLLVAFEDIAGLEGKIRDLPPAELDKVGEVGDRGASLGDIMHEMFNTFSGIALAAPTGGRGVQFRILKDQDGMEGQVEDEVEVGGRGIEMTMQHLVHFSRSMLQAKEGI